jgi:hypothetical protein
MTKKTLAIRENTIFDGVFTKYVLKFIFSIWFKLRGWKVDEFPPEGAGVAIAAPHTSNWDFLFALGAAILQDIKIYFSIKDTMCRVPLLGPCLMYLGAMPIDRSPQGKGQVEQIKDFIETQKGRRVYFLFTPEGTRGTLTKWKTGFYHVAQGCNLPIFLARVDYKLKVTGTFHTFKLTGDKDQDIKTIQAAYQYIPGKEPINQYPAYTGSLPKLTSEESQVITTLYHNQDVLCATELAKKLNKETLRDSVIPSLIDKMLIDEVLNETDEDSTALYQLSYMGKGASLHLMPQGKEKA